MRANLRRRKAQAAALVQGGAHDHDAHDNERASDANDTDAPEP